MVSTFIILLVFLSIVFSAYLKRTYDYWKIKGIPHVPPTIPIDLILGRISLAEHIQTMYHRLKTSKTTHGGYIILNLPIFHPISPDLIKTITIKHHNYFHSRGFYHTDSDPLSQHLVSLTGHRWKKTRRILSSLLTSTKLKRFTPKLTASAQELTETIDRQRTTECTDLISRWINDNIISCIFGAERECLKNPRSQLHSTTRRLSQQIFGNITYNFIAIVFSNVFEHLDLPLTGRGDRKFLLGFLKKIVDHRLENDIKTNDFIDEYVEGLRSGGDREFVSFDEFASMIFTFFIAGSTSTFTTMVYLLYELSINADVQDALRDEINRCEDLDYNTIVNLNYLDKVVNETLRKYPVTPFLIRECAEPYRIPGTDRFLDKGTVCWISTYSLHRDAEYYPEPEKFDPERFSEDARNERHPFCFIPFGDGLRNCIGQRFGLLQIKLGIVRLISRYSIDLDPKTPVPIRFSSHSILLVPKDEIFIRFKKIDK